MSLPKKSTTRVRSHAGADLGLLVNLLRSEKIGYRTLLRNISELVSDDYDLLSYAVLIVTDENKIKASGMHNAEFEEALESVVAEEEFRGKESVVAAISKAMNLVA